MIQKITDEEIAGAHVARLADRPNQNSRYGGSVMSADQLKAAFDALPELICRKFNALIDALPLAGERASDDIAELIATDLEAGHSLADLFREIGDGGLSRRLALGEESLARFAERLAGAFVGLSYDYASGVFTFTRANGENVKFDLPIERLIVGGTVEGDDLCFHLYNGETLSVPLGSLATALNAARIAAERAASKVEEADTVVTKHSTRLVTSGAVKDALDALTLSVEGGITLDDATATELEMIKGSGRLGNHLTATYDISDTEVKIGGMLTYDYDDFTLPIATLSVAAGRVCRISAVGYGNPYPSGGYLRLSAYAKGRCVGSTVQVSTDGMSQPDEFAEPIVLSFDEDTEVTLMLEAFAGSASEMHFDEGYTLSANAILSDCTVVAEHHKEYRIFDFDRVDLYLPETLPENYAALLTFRSNGTGSTLTYDASILWSGEDCTADGVFIPRPDKVYDILLRYNGASVRGFVSGVLL